MVEDCRNAFRGGGEDNCVKLLACAYVAFQSYLHILFFNYEMNITYHRLLKSCVMNWVFMYYDYFIHHNIHAQSQYTDSMLTSHCTNSNTRCPKGSQS